MQRVVVVVMMRLVRNDTCMWWIHLQHEIKQQRERGRACSTVVLVVYIVGTYIHIYFTIDSTTTRKPLPTTSRVYMLLPPSQHHTSPSS